MKIYALIAIINAIFASILGLYVYFKNRKRLVNKIFGFFCLSISIWSYGYFFWQLSLEKSLALFWCRVLMGGAIFIPITYLHFIVTLVDKNKEKRKEIILGYLIFIFFFFFNFTSFFVKNVSPKLNFPFWPNPGVVFHPFLLLWIAYAFYTVYFLARQLSISSGILQMQLKYILLGTTVGIIGGITNYFLWYDIPIPPVGNWTASFYVIMVAYSILRYRFMDIRFVIGRTAVYILSFVTVIAIAFGLIILNQYLGEPLPFVVLGPLIIILTILLFQLFFRLYETIASKYFYYTFYSYQQVLSDLGRRLTEILDLQSLNSLIVNTLINTMKLDKTGILLRDPETGVYRIQKIIGFKEENGISLVKDNFLTQYLERTRKPLVYEELALIIKDTKGPTEKEKLKTLQANMKKIEASVCLPLLRKNKITGLIVLGKKISGEPYTQQDLDLLATLSSQASVALENAKLYAEIRDLSQHLQEKVDEQTKELRKAYEVEKKARKELQRLNEAKNQFLMATQHHLRTPLTAMKGYIDLILGGSYGKTSNKLKQAMKKLQASTSRELKIVNELLDISQFQLGKQILSLESGVKIETILKEIIEEIRFDADTKGIYLKLEKPKRSLPPLKADPEKLKVALSNIIDNAIKYTNKGGVTIKIKEQKSNIKNKSKLQIIIKDTGMGIPKEDLPRLFARTFERGKEAKRAYTTGRGIGLFITGHIIRAHGGKVWAESKGKNKGSTFYVELPVER